MEAVCTPSARPPQGMALVPLPAMSARLMSPLASLKKAALALLQHITLSSVFTNPVFYQQLYQFPSQIRTYCWTTHSSTM